MAIAFRTASATSVTSGFTNVTSKALTLSSSIVTGDLVLVAVAAGTAGASTTITLSGGSPLGGSWTQTGTTVLGGGSGFGTGVNLAVFAGTATALTPGAAVTGTPGVSAGMMLAAASWSGAGAVDVSGSGVNTSGSGVTTLAEPTVSITPAGDWLADVLATWTASTASPTITNPADASTSRVTAGATFFQFLGISDSNGTVGTGTQGGGSWSWTGNAAPAGFTVAIKLGVTAHSGTAALSGSGALAGTGAFAGAAALSGTGKITTPRTNWMVNALDGQGTLSGTGSGRAGVQLSGSGALGTAAAGYPAVYGPVYGAGVPRTVIWRAPAALSGTGTLGGGRSGGKLTGTGTLSVSGVLLGYPAALSGSGTMTVLKVLGGLVSATSLATVPCAYPNSSQVAVAAPGSANWTYLGSLGVVTSLVYSFTCPGGADHMTCTVMVPAAYRTQAFNPGSAVRITRGGHVCWTGKLDEPVPTPQGWNLSAVGDGNRGTDFLAVYSSSWPSNQPDESINGAIGRGLPWANPGVGSPAGAWYGQQVDSAGQTITSLLNLICTRGGLTWYVNSQPGGIPGTDLNVFPLPTAVNRLLVCTTPVPRTLGGDVNTIWIRYQSSADTTSGSSTPATFGLTSAVNAQSVAAHGTIETFIDLSDVGTMSAGAAQAAGQAVLAIYVRASFAGPFQASYGQLMNPGGVPIDPGTDQAGTVVRLLLTDGSYGGEVTPDPVTFLVGSYSWDDTAQVATLSPYQHVDQSLSGLLSLENTALMPVTVGG